MEKRLQAPGLSRRRLLQALAAAGAAGLGGCASQGRVAGDRARLLAPLRARPDRIIDITVCLRPFRAAGPRLDTERIGDALVIHNYGHGGSGWSLSWGSSILAVDKALAQAANDIAVVGCGVMGLTSALLAQAAGKSVTIYTRETIQQTFSARASGSFTPDSRIALADAVSPEFPQLWEQMARTSLKMFRSHLGLSGDPVRWIDRYVVADSPDAARYHPAEGELRFANFGDRLRDLFGHAEVLPAGDTPFRVPGVRRRSVLMFNIASYSQMLMNQFRLAGGQIRHREFHEPAELGQLREKVVMNCTGYGARALWRDETVVPVRGQIAWLVPQPEFDYALAYRDVNVIPRSEGIAVQAVGGGDMRGYDDDSLQPHRQESDEAVQTLAALFSRFRRT